jgi:trans-aconitate methyltransferase
VTRAGSAPERLVAAVEALELRPGDEVLEIGCGRGVAAELICRRLTTGHLLALDRSTTAISAATARNADAVAAGRATFVTAALEDTGPGLLGGYHRVLAVNVNLFWTGPAQRELRLIADHLRPDGTLWLWYDPPDPGRADHIESRLLDHLRRTGFRADTDRRPAGRSLLLSVRATRGHLADHD